MQLSKAARVLYTDLMRLNLNSIFATDGVNAPNDADAPNDALLARLRHSLDFLGRS
jgi:hypothetical protein